MMANLWGRGKESDPYTVDMFMPKYGRLAFMERTKEEDADPGYVPEEQMLKMIDGLMEHQERKKQFQGALAERQKLRH